MNGHTVKWMVLTQQFIIWATCQNRTDISYLEGRHNYHYTNVAYFTQMCERTGTSGDFLRASDRTWTDNLLITNQLHHQLCYRGISTTFTVMWSTKTSSLWVVSNHNDKFICENFAVPTRIELVSPLWQSGRITTTLWDQLYGLSIPPKRYHY